jgi:hypothetical protein
VITIININFIGVELLCLKTEPFMLYLYSLWLLLSYSLLAGTTTIPEQQVTLRQRLQLRQLQLLLTIAQQAKWKWSRSQQATAT